MNPSHATGATRFRVGIFTLIGLLLIGLVTVLVNDKPYWWRPCQLVHINVEDATGLKTKSPIRSLGLEIGYLSTVQLTETYVDLGICVTAPVEVLSSTRAYIRGEGFLGDKFVELKPVKYVGNDNGKIPAPLLTTPPQSVPMSPTPQVCQSDAAGQSGEFIEETSRPYELRGAVRNVQSFKFTGFIERAISYLIPSAHAEPVPAKRNAKGERQIPVGEGSQDVQHLVNRVDDLVNEMTNLTTNLKSAINPEELRSTMKQLNKTLENASKTLSPEGGLNTTAQRTLAKLEDAIEQLRDMMTRVNKGEGSVGMLINDPSYADEIREAIRNVNRLLSRVGGVKFMVDVGASSLTAYNGSRGWFELKIYPRPDRYYRLGVAVDPRGKKTDLVNTTSTGSLVTVTTNSTVEPNGLLLTGMLGKVFNNRIDLSLGVLYGDGDVSAAILFGPNGVEDRLKLITDVYSHGTGSTVQARFTAQIKPWNNVYVKGGIESTNQINGNIPYFYGAGISFEDEDIKLLFALR